MPAKLERCVSKVTKQQKDKGKSKEDAKSSAYAICSSSTGIKRKKGGGWKKEKTVKENTLAVSDLIYNVYNKNYADAFKALQVVIDEKIKDRIKGVTKK